MYAGSLGFSASVENACMSEPPDYHGYRFQPEIIAHTVWLYHRFTLGLRDVEGIVLVQKLR